MKDFIKRWLEKLEKANKDNFGDKPLDCCSLGRDQKQAKPMETTQNKK